MTVTGLPSGAWAPSATRRSTTAPHTADPGTFRLVNPQERSGTMLDVSGSSSDDGAAVIEWLWTGGTKSGKQAG